MEQTEQAKLTKYILNNFRVTSDGITTEKALTFTEVLEIKLMCDDQRRGSGRTLEQIKASTESGEETWYVLTLWYAGGDDADDWCNIFDYKEKAIENYHAYK